MAGRAARRRRSRPDREGGTGGGKPRFGNFPGEFKKTLDKQAGIAYNNCCFKQKLPASLRREFRFARVKAFFRDDRMLLAGGFTRQFLLASTIWEVYRP